MLTKKILYSRKDIDLIIKTLDRKKTKIGMCHGVFDILHIGHINHFKYAKRKCDILIVSITEDSFVNKDIRRPFNDIDKRLETIASLECVDYVIVSKSKFADKNINSIKPNYYFKDKEYKNLKNDLGISVETKAVTSSGGKVIFTNLPKLSSSDIFKYYQAFDSNTFLKNFTDNISFSFSKSILRKISKLNLLITGEIIFDFYQSVSVMGIPSKSACLSALKGDIKKSYGGIFAIGMHLSSFVNSVTIISNCTDLNLNQMKKNIAIPKNLKIINVMKESIIKTRYLTNNSTLIELSDIPNDSSFRKLDKKYISTLKKESKKNDLILLADYGHGLINKDEMNKFLKDNKIPVYINVQSNSHNRGYNFIQQYHKSNLIVLDKNELKVNFRNKNINNFDKYMKDLSNSFKCPVILTLGEEGSKAIDHGKIYSMGAFTKKVVDAVGAGDCFFSMASIFFHTSKNMNFSMLIGNIAGCLATQYQGNSDYINKKIILTNLKNILN